VVFAVSSNQLPTNNLKESKKMPVSNDFKVDGMPPLRKILIELQLFSVKHLFDVSRSSKRMLGQALT